MIKIVIIWLFAVMSSPFVVLIGKELFQVDGWNAIGNYNFDIYDGLRRSIYFFAITVPVLIALYLGKPRININRRVKLSFKLAINKRHILLMVIFCLTTFYFNLGITGVETETGGLRLSGVAYYIRTYLFMFLIGIYIFGSKDPSLSLLFSYSLIAGITAGSRLVAVSPLIILLLRHIYDQNGKLLNFRGGLIVVYIFLLFSFVTFFRNILYADNYSFNSLSALVSAFDFSESEFFFSGFFQLLLRIGIGRDVILSYEISNLGRCTDLWGLLFQSGSCLNPPMDFYGLYLDSDRFYAAPPMLSSLFIISDNFLVQLFIALTYSSLVYIICFFVTKIRHFPLGDLLVRPTFFLVCVFATIGPILYAWYIVGGIVFATFIYLIIRIPHSMRTTSRASARDGEMLNKLR